jgi:hypothetical protein
MRQGRHWSEQDDALLLALARDGVSHQRIAIRLKRTRRAIETRLSFLRRQQASERQDSERAGAPP